MLSRKSYNKIGKYWGSNRQLEANEAVWKLITELLHYVKQICLLVQFACSPTNFSQLQKTKHQSESVFKNLLSSKGSQSQMVGNVTCPCNTKEHQNFLSIFENFWGFYTKKWSYFQHKNCQNINLSFVIQTQLKRPII